MKYAVRRTFERVNRIVIWADSGRPGRMSRGDKVAVSADGGFRLIERWDREPVAEGLAAKSIKRSINAMIAPLSGTRDAIIAALDQRFVTDGGLGERLIGFSAAEPART